MINKYEEEAERLYEQARSRAEKYYLEFPLGHGALISLEYCSEAELEQFRIAEAEARAEALIQIKDEKWDF